MSTRTGWFAGDEPADDRARGFVATVAAIAPYWPFADLVEADTSSRPAPAGDRVEGVVIEVRVPRLTTARRTLWVRYDPEVRGLPVLTSQWISGPEEFDSRDGYDPDFGFGFEPPDEEADLWVSGAEVTPEQCGAWTAAWLERQLRRPVCRREWDAPTTGWSTLIPRRHEGSAIAVQWTVGDPECVLEERTQRRWDWLRDRPPAREVWERPENHAA